MLRLSCGSLSVIGGSRLLGGTQRSDAPFFLCDCNALQRPPPTPENIADSGRVLAVAFSPSGKFFALTDDRKRLVLYRAHPAWETVSVRWVPRRCTAVTFSACESYILVGDKSGDVWSFSVSNIQEEGRLELGHLSMLLDVVVTPDGRYVITCDRDEKIRVSLWEAPHVITAFCLGHSEFVSRLSVMSDDLLLSGSGDGSVRLWRYDSGEEICSWNLQDVLRKGDGSEIQRLAVSRLSCAPGGDHVAVLCDGVGGVFVFSGCSAPPITHSQYLPLPYVPLDVDFDDSASLWVLSGVKENPIELLTYKDGAWQATPPDDHMKRLCDAIRENWDQLEGAAPPEQRCGGLYKVTCDNMAAYMMKKEARLQAEKRKTSPTHPHPNVKLQKT